MFEFQAVPLKAKEEICEVFYLRVKRSAFCSKVSPHHNSARDMKPIS